MIPYHEDIELAHILRTCSKSLKAVAQVLFPERFTTNFSILHDQIFDALDKTDAQKIVIAAPRGFGKTSLMNLALPAKSLLFREKQFIVPVSASSTNAVMQSENLKKELQTNIMIKKLFGDIRPTSRETNFSHDMWEVPWGAMVMPRGRGQQIRGLLHGNNRPDLIVVDDLEDTEEVRSEEQRAKVKEWFFSDLCNAINVRSDSWRIVVIGTILSETCLLQELLDSEEWLSIKLELCDDNYISNWPEMISDAKVKQLAESLREMGLLDVFFREYRNLAIAGEDACFQQAMFKYYEESDLKGQWLENIVVVDPAKTVKVHSAESAIVGVGINSSNHTLYVRDIVHKKLHPEEIYEETFAMCDRLGANVFGIEVTSLNEFITYPARDAMARRGKFYEMIELKARGQKADRIAALIPFYRRGLVYHNKAICGALEAQLLSYPVSKLWDVMDAFAYVVEMMEMGDRYPGIRWEEDPVEVEKEYEELEAEQLSEGELVGWRMS
jgi:hypothetical protein